MFQYYLEQDALQLLHKEYLRASPHLSALPDLRKKIGLAVRNGRSHFANLIKKTLGTALPSAADDKGVLKVCSLFVC